MNWTLIDFNQQYNNCSHSVKRTEILFALKLGFMLEKSTPLGGTHIETEYGDRMDRITYQQVND